MGWRRRTRGATGRVGEGLSEDRAEAQRSRSHRSQAEGGRSQHGDACGWSVLSEGRGWKRGWPRRVLEGLELELVPPSLKDR